MSKKKIFYALSVFLILGMTMSAINVRAHAPINIDIEYYVGNQELSIRLTHGVSDPVVHRIYEIDVWVNHTQIWQRHIEHTYHYDDQDNYAIAVLPTGPPTYTFNNTNHPDFDEQPTDVTPITISHTLPIYILPFPAQLTGEPLDGAPIDENTGLPVPYLDVGRTNITVSVKCSLGGVLTEHYYVGLPYYNPHLTFAEAAMPATISTIVVITLLFILPKLGQKNAPKLEIKSKH
jgi:hypothetical protein